MKSLCISGPTLRSNGQIVPSTLRIEQGKIVSIEDDITNNADIISKGVIAPGFIDLQVNGGYGEDFTDNPQAIIPVAARLPETGVTAFLPTRITSALTSYPDWLRTAEEAAQQVKGAQVLGFHLEGPFFNLAKKGAHNPALVYSEIDLAVLDSYAGSSMVKIVTLAPELPGAIEAIGYLRKKGIIVSAGHSNATFDQAQAGFQTGIGWGTHLFNAMSEFKQREPGLPGALLTAPIACGLIADGIHVHPAALRIAWLSKGSQGITLVTDCMAAMGMAPGVYRLGTAGAVTVDHSTARLADGTLAGSIATMDQCVRLMHTLSGCPLADALIMASTTPADLLGLSHKGRLAPGCDADVVVLDEEMKVQMTIIGGEVIYQN
ncbi:MAG: N-acetylglucosamine-6-phosphate deacetylase [Caldilineaceae bacterium]